METNYYFRSFITDNNKTSCSLISACASRCLSNAIRRVGAELVEPVMLIEVCVIADDSGVANPEPVISELVKRRGTILEIIDEGLFSIKISKKNCNVFRNKCDNPSKIAARRDPWNYDCHKNEFKWFSYFSHGIY